MHNLLYMVFSERHVHVRYMLSPAPAPPYARPDAWLSVSVLHSSTDDANDRSVINH